MWEGHLTIRIYDAKGFFIGVGEKKGRRPPGARDRRASAFSGLELRF